MFSLHCANKKNGVTRLNTIHFDKSKRIKCTSQSSSVSFAYKWLYLLIYLVNSCFYDYFALIPFNIANLMLFKNSQINFSDKHFSKSQSDNK